MTVRFYKLGDEGAEYSEVAVVEDGEIVEGEDELPPLHPEELDDEERLLEHYDGPYLVAAADDTEIEQSYVITEPRLGIVGKYDDDGFEYNGADESVSRFLEMGEPSGLEATKTSLVPETSEGSNLMKQAEDAWIPYQGPQGGEGWQQVGTGEVRYQQDPPGEVAEGYDENHWRQHWPELEDTEWNEELPSAHEMKEGDSVLFVNRNGEGEVGEVVGYGFVRREDWDHSKVGIELRDGREVVMDEIAAYAPTASVEQPPELYEDPGWGEAPGVWHKYGQDQLVHFRNEDDETEVGVVEGTVKDSNAVKILTTHDFHVVQPDQILHRADPEDGYNRGYAILDTPFDDIPEIEFSDEPPSDTFASDFGATTEDVWNAFGTVFSSNELHGLERHVEENGFDSDDPEELMEAIVEYRGDTESWVDLKREIRGRANGVGKIRAKRIIDEAFFKDLTNPRYDVSEKMEDGERANPESWLRAASELAMEDDWVSIGNLQDSIDEWSGTVPLDASHLHGHDGEPDEVIPLSETGENAGISAGAMFIAEWPDGDRSYITRVRDDVGQSGYIAPSTDAERAMTGYEVQSSLNEDNDTVHYPNHTYRHDSFLSVDSAPEDSVLAEHYLDEFPTKGVEMPDGRPENEIVEEIGATAEDVQDAIYHAFGPGFVDRVKEQQIDQDPNLNADNPADWVAGIKSNYDRDVAHVWNGFIEEIASQSYESPVNRDDYMDMAAAAIIAGNRDLHAKNVMADEDGHIYPIDLDFAGYNMKNDRNLSEAVSKLVSTAENLGIEASEEFSDKGNPKAFDKSNRPLAYEIVDYIESFAEDWTPDDVRSTNPMYYSGDMGDNVQRNIEAARNGEFEL
jgi:hypothetical protein